MNTFAYTTCGSLLDTERARNGFRCQRLEFDNVLSLDEIRSAGA